MAVNVLHFNLGGARTKTSKWHNLTNYARRNKYDVACVCETHCNTDEIVKHIAPALKENVETVRDRVFASHNPDNIYKGGVAIIIFNPEIRGDIIEHDSDPNVAQTWAGLIQPAHSTIPLDAIRGRYITVKITTKKNNQFFVSEIYAPADGPAARDYFYKFLDTELSINDPAIVMGDFNNVEDPSLDVIRVGGNHVRDHEDMSNFFDFCANRELEDSYLAARENDDDPRVMTNMSDSNNNNVVTYKRLDRAYNSPALNDKIYIRNAHCRTTDYGRQIRPISITSTHNPIEIAVLIDEPEENIPYYHDIWRMNTYVATQKDVRDQLNDLKHKYWNKCKDRHRKTKLDMYVKFKTKCTKLLKGHQDKQHRDRQNEKEKLKKIMEYTQANSPQAIRDASTRFHQIEDLEREGARIRSRCERIEGEASNSKYHYFN